MRRRSLKVTMASSLASLALAAGCAQLIGAEFDGARLGDDSGTDATTDASFDVMLASETAPQESGAADALDAELPFDARAPADGGLLLWLAADLGVIDAGMVDAGPPGTLSVGQWEDQSGLGRNVVPPSAPQRPLLVTVGDAGHAAVRFERDRLTYFYSPKWSGPPGVKGTTIFVVAKGVPDSLVRFQGSGPGRFVIFPWNARASTPDDPDHTFFVGTGPDSQKIRTTFSRDEWTVAVAQVELGALGGMRVYRNGALVEQASVNGDAMPATDAFTIGCTSTATECAEADVAEVLIYGAAITETERQTVERYLQKKWSVTF